MAGNDSLPNQSNTTTDCEDDGVVTMVDVLKAEELLEENADAVLGPGDDKNCTYKEGYLKRQALYSCLTCLPADGLDRAGLCLACSYHCHADHELVELYTKRNFRCDCGNSLFKGKNCTLEPAKSAVNEENSYNQNFRGVYCTCSRPYPDPEDSVEDEMIQCIVCEDWYHTRHLDAAVPKEDDYAEMICGPCTDRLPFLQYYLGHAVTKITKSEEEGSEANINVAEENSSLNTSQEIAAGGMTDNDSLNVDTSGVTPETQDGKCLPQNTPHDKNKETNTKEICQVGEANEVPEENQATSSPQKSDSELNIQEESGCKKNKLKMLPRGNGATFWPDNFRKLLCGCSSCKEMYENHRVPFLIEEGDTVRVYEEEGRGRRRAEGATQYERGMEALSSLDRVQQMEAILSYNEMKTHLSEYLAKFVENKKVVREEDIREFFTGMQARKRQKLDIPYNCR